MVTIQRCQGKYLYIANVLDPYTHIHLCTGVLLDSDQVAIPAQCVLKEAANEPGSPVYFPIVRMGSKNLNKHEEAGEEEVLEVSQIAVHSGFDGDATHGFDLALLTLSRPSAVPPMESIVPADGCRDGLSLLGWLAPSVQGAPSVNLTAVPRMAYKKPEECDAAAGGMPPNATCAASPIAQALS
ncbi:unnamed protein product, partial [Ostreobium quekettii]